MGNTINYAAIFNQVLDEKFAVNLRTGIMEQNNVGIKWQGGRTVKIPKLSLQGLGTVSNCNLPDGEYTYQYEEKSMQWDRGRTFYIPRYAIDETNFTLTAGNVINTFLKDKVTPEVDSLRISVAAKAALDAGFVTYEGSSVSSTPLADLINDIAFIQDKVGEDKQLYCFITTAKKAALKKSSEINKYLSVRELTIRDINVNVDAINDIPLIGVPSAYMKTAFTLLDGTTEGQEDGGITAADGAKSVNWLIMAKDSAIAVGYPQVEKIITPDDNQINDCWKIMYRTYHGLFVLDNKKDGMWVNVAGAAPVSG